MTKPTILILPGLHDSGPTHWQTLWQHRLPDAHRMRQRDWDTPDRAEWLASLDAAVDAAPAPIILVAHSLSCSLVAHWAAGASASKVAAAMLVAPADVDSEAHTPAQVRGFAPIPLTPLPFPSLVVASADDPYCSIERASHFARSWGAKFVDIGAHGHVNAASNLGDWAEGLSLLAALTTRAGLAP